MYVSNLVSCVSYPAIHSQVQIHLLEGEILEVIKRVKGLDRELAVDERKILETDFPKFFSELCAGDTPELVEETINELFKSMDG